MALLPATRRPATYTMELPVAICRRPRSTVKRQGAAECYHFHESPWANTTASFSAAGDAEQVMAQVRLANHLAPARLWTVLLLLLLTGCL